MKAAQSSLPLVCLLGLGAACREPTVEEVSNGVTQTDDLPSAPDLVGAPARCAAAQGLTGDLLKTSDGKPLCIHFADHMQSELTAMGWNLTAAMQRCSGFTVDRTNGLTVKPSGGSGTPLCKASLPNLPVPSGVNKIAVSIVHSLGTALDSNQRLFLESAGPPIQQIYVSGSISISSTRTVLEFTNVTAGGIFYGSLGVDSMNLSGTLPPWQIQSIAVLASP